MPKSLYSFLKSLKKIFINELIAAEPQYKLIKFDNVSFKLDTTYRDYLVETLSGKNMNAWEKRERKISSILAEKSNIILDVGSNIGVYSILYSKLNPNSCIYAFEPYPINTTQLRKNVGLNNLTNVQIIEKAVGDISMPISFYIPSDDSTTTVTSANEAFTQGWHLTKSIQVTQITIDEFATENNLQTVDLIKLDIEYYELQAVKGAVKVLEKHKPVIICEMHIYEVLIDVFPNMKDRLDKDASFVLEKLLKSLGYYFYALGERGILRVDTMHIHPDERNFLCSTHKSENLFISYMDKISIWKLLPLFTE